MLAVALVLATACTFPVAAPAPGPAGDTAAAPVAPPAPGGFGEVRFVNSGAAKAQADFQRGMALLHDFEYPAAAIAFRAAQSADRDFAMAYWGEAMTFNHPIWMEQDADAARAALARLGPTPAKRREKAKTDREKAYLDAVEILYGEGSKYDRDARYEAAMARLHEQWPDDVDATAFYGLSILGTAHAGRDERISMRAAGVLEGAWADHREHPGLAHYLIHSYDDPTHAPLGLRAARIYSRIAPEAAHAQHMTSHIFLALGMWRESVDANLAAIAAADRMRGLLGRDSLCCGHYPSWLAYSYLQRGETGAARAVLDRCQRQVDQNPAARVAEHAMDPDESNAGSLANMRLRYLVDTGDAAGELAHPPLPATAGIGARLDFAFARALAKIAAGPITEAREAVAGLETTARSAVDEQARKADPDPTWRRVPEIASLEARALLAEREGDVARAEMLLRQATGLEESLPIAFGPPTVVKPTHELLGEFLLRRARKSDASEEFEKALARTPGRRRAIEGLAATREERETPRATP